MVHHGRIDLLMHPLTQRYLAMKWQAYGRFCHLFSLLLYAIFVFLVTLNAMNLMELVRHCPVLLDPDGSVHVYKETVDSDSGDTALRFGEGVYYNVSVLGGGEYGGDCDIHTVSMAKPLHESRRMYVPAMDKFDIFIDPLKRIELFNSRQFWCLTVTEII